MSKAIENQAATTLASAHALSTEQVVIRFGSNGELGLSDEDVGLARVKHGWNFLAEAPDRPLWQKFLGQFKDLVIWILIVAAIVSGILGEWVDTLAILAIVLLNAVIGFLQEERAERALSALRRMSAPLAKAIRDGRLQTIEASELVPGDIVELEAGDNIPADVRLVRAFGFKVAEAALTGESVPSEKDPGAVLHEATALGDRCNMAYMGTIAAAGKAQAVVVAIGMATELGQIAGMLQRHEVEATPLQRRLAELGRILAVICLGIVGLIFALQIARGGSVVEAFLLAVSLAVAAVPEGLPAVVTVALALGLQRMVKRNALVRKLPSVETLGSVSVICSDKTGTLTRNEMVVREVAVGDSRYGITGIGYAPQGEFYELASRNDPTNGPVGGRTDLAIQSDLRQVLAICAWCNNSQLTAPTDGKPDWQVTGDPTEGALIALATKGGIATADRSQSVLFEFPFDSTRKAMSVVVRHSDGSVLMYTKGAPEVILSKCITERVGDLERPISFDRREQWACINGEMASRALRVLGLAYRPISGEPRTAIEENLVFAGLVGMIDPPREEVKEAMVKCREAGIRPVMITGDHPATALTIARELGMAGSSERAVSGIELDGLTDEQLAHQVEQIVVYARVTAEHKLRVVKAWKSRGEVVAMTGDGVNDSPAIKAADIGIAMGITGSDVTKEAADMVLIDDNFASIVNAVEEGRGIFDNIQKVLQYFLSCNLGEILLMLAASLLGWPAPLLPVQLLWINLVTDGLPALALSLEPPEPGVMRRKPRSPHQSILSWQLGWTIVFHGLLVGGVALVAFAFSYLRNPDDVAKARAMTFCVVVYAELLRALAARSSTLTWGQLGFFTNPMLLVAIAVSGLLQVSVVVMPFAQPVFDVGAHSASEWLVVALLGLTPVTVIEVTKLVRAWCLRSKPIAALSL